jgi:hypothetical protein
MALGVGAGNKGHLALYDLGGAACYRQSPDFWCPSGVAPELPQ